MASIRRKNEGKLAAGDPPKTITAAFSPVAAAAVEAPPRPSPVAEVAPNPWNNIGTEEVELLGERLRDESLH